uniref:E3 ubiquitin/ISG15 ligase TRIM25-like n=1 Tax=Pristiophorus japonicus TaxID=55135 RepID=UPI00398F6825
MASPSLRPEDKFICAICLDMMVSPTTIPCGHSFCLQCISSCWEPGSSSDGAHCPQCRHTFTPKPPLYKNLILCEVVEELRSRAKLSPSSPAGPGDVACDVCTEVRFQARKSCLDCLVSYCESHLEPHRREPAFGDHTLVDPLEHLHAQRSCAAHGKALDLFCRTEGMCVCELCATQQHVIHETVTVEEEVGERKKLLLQKKSGMKEQVLKTLAEISNVQKTIDSVKSSSREVRAEITRKFTAMIKVIEAAHKEVIGLIDRDERVTLGQAESIRNQLQQRCAELRGNEQQLGTLLKIKDDLIFLQEPSCLKASVRPLDFPQLKTDVPSTQAKVNEAVTELAAWVKQRVQPFAKQILDRPNIGSLPMDGDNTCIGTKDPGVFIAVCGPTVYGLVEDLLAPAKTKIKSYEKLVMDQRYSEEGGWRRSIGPGKISIPPAIDIPHVPRQSKPPPEVGSGTREQTSTASEAQTAQHDSVEMIQLRRPKLTFQAPVAGLRRKKIGSKDAETLRFNVNSANQCLHFHNGYQTVSHSTAKAYPDHPDRFDFHPQILCVNHWYQNNWKYYCEVELHKSSSTDHICVGITSPGIRRKGKDPSCVLGENLLSCCLDLHLTACNTFLVFNNGVASEIPSVSYNRIGMWWDNGSLSFYSVTDTMTLIYTFTVLSEKIVYPAFRIGPGTAVTLYKLK